MSPALLLAAILTQDPLNTWVKRAPLADSPPSPRLGYEGDCIWDPVRRVVLRYGGHNQGGGGEQNAEVWTFDPATGRWRHLEPDLSPPGVCCAQQNVFDPIQARYLRFPAFSGSHGWQWQRELMLNGAAVWSYDLGENRWRNLSPLPAPKLSPLRCASWDREHEVVVVFGGEGSREGTIVYDPYTNTWAKMEPRPEPEGRSGGNMAYDWVRKRHVLFGAQFMDDPHTWAYDLRKNEWTDLKPDASPPADKNDAVLAYDAVGDVFVCIVKQAKGKGDEELYWLETWVYEPGPNRWRKMEPEREPTPTGNRARLLMSAPELNAVLLENRPHPPRGPAEQQIWSYRYAEGKPRSIVPPELKVVTRAGGATLTWTPDAPRSKVFRAEGALPWKAEFKVVAEVEGGTWKDEGLAAGTIYHYRVQGGGETRRARTQPRIVEDLVATALSTNEVALAWKRSLEEDVTGYHIERAAVEVYSEEQVKRLKDRTPPLDAPSVGAVRRIGPFRRLTESPVTAGEFRDRGVDLKTPQKVEGESVYERDLGKDAVEGKPYRLGVFAYRIRAVNALGIESGPSAAVLTIPASVRGLFSKEEGTACRLKWEKGGAKGFRVYRMDARYDKDPVSRLTPDPIEVAEFSDPAAGKSSRRYYVIAVDALGQEGAPSSPVWHNREWKRFYEPFTGEWHQ